MDIAKVAAQAILSSSSATRNMRIGAQGSLAFQVLLRGDTVEAQEQYIALETRRGTIFFFSQIAADRLLGSLCVAQGKPEVAVTYFEDAVALCRDAGYHPELAWTCHDYAEALLSGTHSRAVQSGNREKSKSLLTESLTLTTELGMRPLMERVVALQERLQSRPTRAPVYPDGLTQREVEVLRLVAAGKTDREIAEELFIGARTLTTHVSNILNKVNAVNRTEATAYATRRGLA